MEPFEYPEDRAELFGKQNEEEAWFYFILNDFKDLINHYGVDFVMNRLDTETYSKLSSWFGDPA